MAVLNENAVSWFDLASVRGERRLMRFTVDSVDVVSALPRICHHLW
jgi:hypothetical protein